MEVVVEVSARVTIPDDAVFEYAAQNNPVGYFWGGNYYSFYLSVEMNEELDVPSNECLGNGIDIHDYVDRTITVEEVEED